MRGTRQASQEKKRKRDCEFTGKLDFPVLYSTVLLLHVVFSCLFFYSTFGPASWGQCV